MKRIIGRRHLTADQYGDYGNYKVPCVDITRLFVGGLPVPHRQAWASSVIDEWLIAGKVTYKALDVGTNDGLLCAIIASKHLSPRDDSSDTIYVDGIEIHDSAYQASSELSKTMCEKGFKMHVHKVLFEDYETPIKYDVIFAFEMLEAYYRSFVLHREDVRFAGNWGSYIPYSTRKSMGCSGFRIRTCSITGHQPCSLSYRCYFAMTGNGTLSNYTKMAVLYT